VPRPAGAEPLIREIRFTTGHEGEDQPRPATRAYVPFDGVARQPRRTSTVKLTIEWGKLDEMMLELSPHGRLRDAEGRGAEVDVPDGSRASTTPDCQRPAVCLQPPLPRVGSPVFCTTTHGSSRTAVDESSLCGAGTSRLPSALPPGPTADASPPS